MENDPDNKKQRQAAAIAVVLILVLGAGAILLVRTNRSLQRAITHLEGEQATLKGILEKKDRVTLVDADGLSLLIEEITKIGETNNIDFIAIQTQAPRKVKKSRHRKLSLEINVRSDFRELGAFLGALRDLKQATMVITQFKFERDQTPSLIHGKIVGEVLITDDSAS